MKIKFLNLVLALLAILVAMPAQSATTPKREHRSAWVTTAWCMCWPTTQGASASHATAQKAEADAILDIMQENGFNAVYFQVRGMSDAMYKSSYEPWSSYITGVRGTTPTYDPLEYWVNACHERGMECFAWVNPYRYESSISSAPWKGANDYRTTNPDWILEYNNMSILNPGIEAVQTRIVDVCREIISNYDVDGLVFDDYFYLNSIPLSYDSDTYSASGSSLSQADWRRNNVNTMVSKVYNMIQTVKPYVKFGISPAGVSKTSASKYGISTSSISSASDWQYSQIYSDPLTWLANGTVDFISPQLYWIIGHSTNDYDKLSKWWSNACANVFDRHFYSSHSISFLDGANTETNWSEVADQVQLNRDHDGQNAPGSVFFGSRDFTGVRNEGLAPYLKENKFQNLALPPTLTFKSSYSTNPGKVTNLTLTGTTLSWTGYNNMRYVVYAVPTSVTIADDADISSQYILGNPYSTSFDISGYTSGYKIGVSVLDRYGYEFDVAWLGDDDDSGSGDSGTETGTLSQVTINTPADGSTVTGSFTFGWTALSESDVTYTLEVSETSGFNTRYTATTTGNSYPSGNFTLSEGTTYYWRVKASKSGYTDSPYSWVGSFTVAASSSGGGSTSGLVTDPATYNTVNGMSIESKWIYSANTNNMPSELTAANRGIAAYNGNVYISQQGGSLLEYSGETGELLRTITLSGDCKTSSSGTNLSYVSNDVFVDGAGNLCVSNMTINTTTQPLTVCTVNTSTGVTTRVFEMSLTSSSERIDYAAAYGDVTATGGQIWAAVASSTKVYRWTRNSDGSWTEASTTIGTYYGGASNNSTAPRIMPISTTQFILDGHNSAPALYTFKANGTATYNDGFGSNTAIAPTANNWNGICAANLGGTPIFVYSNAIDPSSFTVVTNPSNYSFSAMSKLWTLPANGLGAEKDSSDKYLNGTASSQPAAINNADGSVSLFVYTPCNGLACYLLKNNNTVTNLESVTLTTPTEGATVAAGFDFYWTSISGASYTLEVSTSSTFSTVDFTATTTSSSYSSSKFALESGTTYYWRVKASKSGYNSSASAIGKFTTEVPTVAAVTLTAPTEGATVSANGFTFRWSAVEGATYTLELTTLQSFASIMYKAEGLTTNSLSSDGIELLEGTTYYWHVHASKDGYVESISDTGSFVTPVTSTEDDNDDDNTTGPDGSSYSDAQGLNIECLWIYSINNANLHEQLTGDQRGMAIHNGNVYISERSNGKGYLLEFNGETGEFIREIALTGDYLTLSDGSSLGYPCNDVFSDAAGNLCVSNMVTSIYSSSQLNVCTVDVSTGKTTRVFESYLTDRAMRFDYCMVYGDITKKGAKVFAAPSGNSATVEEYKKRVFCWTRSADHTSADDVYEDWLNPTYSDATGFYPTSAGNFGNAPRVLPISDTRIIIDGATTYPTLYNFGSSLTIEDSFASNTSVRPAGFLNAGMCVAEIKGKPLFIYSFNDNEIEFFNFAVAYNPSDFSFADMQILWKIPELGLGNVGNTAVSAIPATITNEDGSLTLFIYVPNNGLAAYKISDATLTGIEELGDTGECKIKMEGRTARLSKKAEAIKVYSAAGVLVATATDSNSIDLSALASGVYVINTQNEDNITTQKVILE